MTETKEFETFDAEVTMLHTLALLFADKELSESGIEKLKHCLGTTLPKLIGYYQGLRALQATPNKD